MKKKCRLLAVTFVFAVCVLLYGFWFVYKKTILSMFISGALIVLLCILYSYCAKKTTFPEGYTLVQAFLFYRECKKKGVEPFDSAEGNILLLRDIARQRGMPDDLDNDALKKAYLNGEEAEAVIRLRNK